VEIQHLSKVPCKGRITPTTAIITTCSSNKHCFSTNDTSFSLNKEDIQLMSAEEIYNKLREIGGDNFNHVTISGGNPSMVGIYCLEFLGQFEYDVLQINLLNLGYL
jgi:organic radical activating enzyme